eukprot:scaffold13432_cov107-Isochrysis_galbana.AAC.2
MESCPSPQPTTDHNKKKEQARQKPGWVGTGPARRLRGPTCGDTHRASPPLTDHVKCSQLDVKMRYVGWLGAPTSARARSRIRRRSSAVHCSYCTTNRPRGAAPPARELEARADATPRVGEGVAIFSHADGAAGVGDGAIGGHVEHRVEDDEVVVEPEGEGLGGGRRQGALAGCGQGELAARCVTSG